MRLSQFIRQARAEIVDLSVEFAKSLPPLSAQNVDVATLRDRLPLILETIALDLEQPQTRAEAIVKSEGRAAAAPSETPAQTHGRERADSGLTVAQVFAEYRLLRASVVRLWFDKGGGLDPSAVADLTRFNEAVDQALAESVAYHSAEVDRLRNLFLGVVGHDLRGPLNAVVLGAELLSRERSSGPFSDYTAIVKRGGERMTELLDSLLDYNRSLLGLGMTLHRGTVDLARICREEVELLRTALPDSSISYQVRGNCSGDFDASRVKEALSNLVFNAAQYSRPGSTVRVSVDGRSERVVLAVSNEGAPISPEVLSRLFEPLKRGDRDKAEGERRNLGLGLFIVREIARAHGGEVSTEVAEGRIAFVIQLPKPKGS